MAEIIRMPRLSDTMEEGVIVGWMKEVGDKVEPGDILAEVETDKATMELESFNEGVLLHIGVEEGPVPVDGVIAVIGEEGEDFKAQLEKAEANGSTAQDDAESKDSKEEESTDDTSDTAEPKQEQAPQTGESQSDTDDSRVKASPLAKAMAAEAGLQLANIQGSGDNGRIVKRDVEAAMSGDSASGAKRQVTAPKEEYGEVRVSQMRKTIARRLAESKFTAPHFYLTVEIDMSVAVSTRKALNENEDVRVSFNDMVVKASALALKKHPGVNASWHGDTIRKHENVNIGIAVAIDDGLLVPVVRDADLKGMRQIHSEVVEYAGRAKEKKLQPEEMQGNTFTISNLGMFGIDEFTAIINPPESCILAVGSIVEKPVVKNGEITTAHMMKVTMSCDHRVVDGATGAQFLQTLRSFLEQPLRMLA